MTRPARLPLSTMSDLSALDCPEAWKKLETRARSRRKDTLGLDLAMEGPVPFPAWTASDTLRQALHQLAEDTHGQRPWEQLDLRREEDVWSLRRRFLDGRAIRRRQEAEMGIAGLLRHLREVLGPGWQPVEVHFQHARPLDLTRHSEVLGAAVLFGREYDAIYLSDTAMRHPVQPQALDRGAAPPVAITPDWPQPTLAARVLAEIRSQMSLGEPRLDPVAEALRVSPWTLRRRLAREGEVFSDMVAGLRRDLSLVLLEQPHIPVTEISAMLGYSEVSAFSRVCRRWFGQSPSTLRAARAAQTIQN